MSIVVLSKSAIGLSKLKVVVSVVVVVILFNIPDNTRVALYIILKISLKVNIPYNIRVACLFHSIGCSTPLMRKELKVGDKLLNERKSVAFLLIP